MLKISCAIAGAVTVAAATLMVAGPAHGAPAQSSVRVTVSVKVRVPPVRPAPPRKPVKPAPRPDPCPSRPVGDGMVGPAVCWPGGPVPTADDRPTRDPHPNIPPQRPIRF